MVEINNQRKAFLDMLAWSEGTDNGTSGKPEIMVMNTAVGGELFTDYSDHRKLVTLNPKLKLTGALTLPASSCWWDARKEASLVHLSEKSDAVALQQIKERGALPMIDRGDIRQAI